MRLKILFILICTTLLNLAVLGQTVDELKQLIDKSKKEGSKTQTAQYLSKLANLYWNNENFKDAIETYKEALNINKEQNNVNGYHKIYDFLGLLYCESNQFANAIDYFQKSLDLSRKTGSKAEIASDLINLANAYAGVDNADKAIKLADEALSFSKEANNIKLIKSAYGLLADNYKKIGNNDKANEYFSLYSTFDAHIKNQELKEKDKEVSEMKNRTSVAENDIRSKDKQLETKNVQLQKVSDSLQIYDKKTKEQVMEINLLNSENKVKDLNLQNQEQQLRLERTIRYSLIGLFLLIFVFSALLYKQYSDKKKANVLLEAQNIEIKKQKEEIEAQKAKVDYQNKMIRDSINYAQNIQNAILPFIGEINTIFDTFIIYRPKDVVSGDFYWYSHFPATNSHPARTFIAAVDCTGHGVPGAFMSMIGNRLLSEIVNEHEISQPAEILEYLNNGIRKALNQRNTENEDGMDICLCRLEPAGEGTTKLIYAGAKRPLFLFDNAESKVRIIEANRRSIGGILNKKEDPFIQHEMIVKIGDALYLSSDGLIDQPNFMRKRFGTQYFIETLQKYSNLKMTEQKAYIEQALDNFKQSEEQRDDIMVIAIKLRS